MAERRPGRPTTLLISENYPPAVGGTSRWFGDLYGRFPRGAAVVATSERDSDPSVDGERHPRVHRLPLGFRERGFFDPSGWSSYRRAYVRLRELCAGTTVDRVHAGRAIPEGWLARRCRRRLGLPFACSVHGEELASAWTSRQLTWMTQRVLRASDLVHANSGHTAGLLVRDWSVAEERIEIERPIVDTERFRPAAPDRATRERLGWRDRPVLLTVARLQKRKGHDVMAAAMARVGERRPDALWAVVGDGEERPALESAVRELGLGDRVILHGELDDARLLEAYQQCELFVLPVRDEKDDFEGFGIVFLEAQACGKPVVVGRSGGTVETFVPGETGELVDGRDPDRVAETVLELLDDPGRREAMGRSGRRRVVERFDAAEGARRWIELLDRRLPGASSA